MKQLRWVVVALLGCGLMVLVRGSSPLPPATGGGTNDLVAPAAFLGFFAGEALFLLAGSFLLTDFYLFLARRLRWGLLRQPLDELLNRRNLLLALHLSYFGLILLFTLIAYQVPAAQHSLLSLVGKAMRQGPLAPVVTAYSSRNILLAAGMTLLINFLGGSVAVITIPSLVLPGVGVLVPLVRASLWGFLLAPTSPKVLQAMVLHTGTLLLEGAGYILAAFFALMVPVYLFGRRGEGSAGQRYVQALLVNLKGNLLVVMVLAVAALYEATEVILQM
jgi:hypothetical protein